MRAYWDQLSERDRTVLCIGGVVCLIYLFYLLIYAPLTNAVGTRSKQWIEKSETLDWMRKVHQQGLIKPSTKVTERNLLLLFSSQLKASPLTHFHYELQQVADDRVQLSFDSVPFGPFLNWFRSLNEQYTMAVTEMNATKTDTAGVVRLKVIVSVNH